MQFFNVIQTILPRELDLISTLRFIGTFAAALLVLSLLVRLFLGRNSGLNHAISSGLGILSIYVATVVIYTFNPGNLARFLAPLPFVSISGEVLHLFSFRGAQLPAVCSQLLSMIILAFLVNLIDSRIPRGKHVLGWFVYRLVSVLAAIGVHYVVNVLFVTFIPGILEGYAPMILVCILLFMLSLGVLKLILGLLLTAVNPIFGALYAFFFSHKTGKQLSKAVLSTAVVSLFVWLLGYYGFTEISITVSALQSGIPLGICLLLLWFLIGYVL